MTSRPSNHHSPLSPELYLDLSRELLKNNSSEYQRTAGDRAYYAAFLFCRDELTKKGYIKPFYSTEDHDYVTRSLVNVLGSKSSMEYWLRHRRNQLTYDTKSVSDISINLMIETAQAIIEAVKALPPKS